jgi:hypothetical protein
MTGVGHEHYYLLLALGVLGISIGVGLSGGKGLDAVSRFLNKGNSSEKSGGVNVSVQGVQGNQELHTLPSVRGNCQECLKVLQGLLPCKDHSGFEAKIENLIKSIDEVKGSNLIVWEAIDGLRKEMKEVLQVIIEIRATAGKQK